MRRRGGRQGGAARRRVTKRLTKRAAGGGSRRADLPDPARGLDALRERPGPVRVIVFGGSFDPVHRWHLSVATAARRSVERREGAEAWVLLVPAARSPHKSVADGPRADEIDRVEMLHRATARRTRMVVWLDELDRAAAARLGGVGAPPSYTIDTLRRLHRRLPRGSKVWLLIGADQAEKFHLWREYRKVMQLAEMLVVLRPPRQSADGLVRAMRAAGVWSESELAAWRARVVRCGVNATSSTRVRAAAARGDAARLGRLVTPPVARWIERRGLYGWPRRRSR